MCKWCSYLTGNTYGRSHSDVTEVFWNSAFYDQLNDLISVVHVSSSGFVDTRTLCSLRCLQTSYVTIKCPSTCMNLVICPNENSSLGSWIMPRFLGEVTNNSGARIGEEIVLQHRRTHSLHISRLLCSFVFNVLRQFPAVYAPRLNHLAG
jgi:hypothetical protein